MLVGVVACLGRTLARSPQSLAVLAQRGLPSDTCAAHCRSAAPGQRKPEAGQSKGATLPIGAQKPALTGVQPSAAEGAGQATAVCSHERTL